MIREKTNRNTKNAKHSKHLKPRKSDRIFCSESAEGTGNVYSSDVNTMVFYTAGKSANAIYHSNEIEWNIITNME